MHFNKMKRWGAVALAGVMAVSLIGCGSKKDDEQTNTESSEASTEEVITEDSDEDSDTFVAGDVDLPSDFGDMIYPLTALMVEASAKGLPYYSEDSTEEEGDSFWFSMAVLASLMNDYVKDVTVDMDDNYLYLEEETVDMYASALYDAYAQGNLEFPELSDDDTYAVYNEDESTYGFLSGGIGTMKAYITDCQYDGGDYILTTELRDTDSKDLYGRFQITITTNSYDGEDNAFEYAVASFVEYSSSDEDGVDFSEGATAEEETTEDLDETDTEETEESYSDDTEEKEISEDEALSLAQEYYGDDAEYTFKDIVTIGDYDYYNFSVEGEGVSSTDVLVSTDGENVLGGVQNDDGSWSFDQ